MIPDLDADEQPTAHFRWFEIQDGEMELQQLWLRGSTKEYFWTAVLAFDGADEQIQPPRLPAEAVASIGRRLRL